MAESKKAGTSKKAEAKVEPKVAAKPAGRAHTVPEQPVKTIDGGEPSLGWTIQHDDALPVATDAGRVYDAAQLPTRAGLKELGLNDEDIEAYLAKFQAK